VINLEDKEESRHILVPKHELVSEEDKKELLESRGINENQLPDIFVTDPGITGLGANLGDVIRVTRESELVGESIHYRIVVEK